MKKFKDPARARAAWHALVDAANRLRTMRASVREAYVIVRERLPWGIAELLPVPAFMKKER